MSNDVFLVDISEVDDVNGLCRVCLTESQTMTSLNCPLETVYENSVTTLFHALKRVAHKDLPDDEKYPSYICSMCLSLLNITYKMNLQLEITQRQLCRHFGDSTYNDLTSLSISMDVENEQASVEIISNQGKYSLQDLLIVEEDNENKPTFDGFLKNLGSEVSAEYVCHVSEKDKPLKIIEDYNVNIIPLSKKDPEEELFNFTGDKTADVEDIEDNEDNIENVDINAIDENTVMDDLTCAICNKTFSQKKNLKRHIKDMHSGINKYLCQVCGHVANAKSSLYNHMLLKHLEKRFECNICGKKYLSGSSLRNHEIVHKNERTHLCVVCGKSFNYSNALEYHMRIHTGEKKYKCPHCTRAFSMQCGLARHVRTHTGIRPYGCKYCDRAFRSKGEVNCHEMTHTGYRPFHCKYCHKGFTKMHNLKVHMMSHSGPHTCEFCQRGFAEVIYLKMHIKLAHGLPDYDVDDVNNSTVLFVTEPDNNVEELTETIAYSSN